MTPAEWFEAYTAASSNGLTTLALLLTIVSGYMVIAYLVGAELTRTQVGIVNLVFIASTSTVLLANYGNVLDAATARFQASQTLAALPAISSDSVTPGQWAVIVTLANSLYMVVALVFMWQVRHPKPK